MKYRTILADPPWMEREGGECVRGAQRHYPLMHTQEIIDYMKAIEVEEDAHLYLWVTNNFLTDGLKVIEALGFRNVTNLVWVKDKIGLGQYFRGQHELCLFNVKGRLPYRYSTDPTRSCCEESTVITARRKSHSEKPPEIYRKIEATSPPPYLEVFARCHREGWDVMGLEAPENLIQIKLEHGEWFK